MKKSIKIIVAGGVAAVLLGSAGLAAAYKYNRFNSWQFSGCPNWGAGYGPGMMGGQNWGPGYGPGMMGRFGGMRGGYFFMLDSTRLSAAEPALNLTEAQKPSWDAFVDAVDQFQTTRQAMFDQMSLMMMRGDASWSDRRAMHDTMMEARSQVWEARTALAGQLTDDQLRALSGAFMPYVN